MEVSQSVVGQQPPSRKVGQMMLNVLQDQTVMGLSKRPINNVGKTNAGERLDSFNGESRWTSLAVH